MEFDPKIAAFSALAAFVISFLLGLIGGATFGTLLMRALVFALVFFLLGAIFSVVFEKFLTIEELDEMGSNVDLSVGDDGEGAYYGAADAQYGAEGAVSGGGSAEGGIGDALDDMGLDGVAGAEGGGLGAGATGLEQNDAIEYNSKQENGVAANRGNATDLSTFIPGLPVSGSAGSGVDELPATGTVEMSVAKRSTNKELKLSDLGKDVSGKKVADAIHTLLVKDEG